MINWEAAGALGEILGAIAVIVTLAYLAIQIKQNTTATRANTRQAILDSDQQLLTYMLENPSIDQLRFSDEMDQEEKTRLGVFLLLCARMRESNWFQYQSGALDPKTWAAYEGSLVFMLGTPNGRKWWKFYSNRPGAFDDDFVALINDLLSKEPPHSVRISQAFD